MENCGIRLRPMVSSRISSNRRNSRRGFQLRVRTLLEGCEHAASKRRGLEIQPKENNFFQLTIGKGGKKKKKILLKISFATSKAPLYLQDLDPTKKMKKRRVAKQLRCPGTTPTYLKSALPSVQAATGSRFLHRSLPT